MLAVAVVLAEENHRQVPQLGHVHRLVEGADVGRTIAEAGDSDPPILAVLRCQREAVGDRQARPDDPGRHHHPARWMGDVHRPALALAGAGGAPGDLGEQQVERHALGDLVVLAAIGGDEIVARLQRRHHRRRHQFLAAHGVIDHRQLAGHQQRAEFLVGAGDAHGAGVDGLQRVAVERHRRSLAAASAGYGGSRRRLVLAKVWGESGPVCQ